MRPLLRRGLRQLRSARTRPWRPSDSDVTALEDEQQVAGAALRAALARHRPRVLLADVFDTVLVRRAHPEDVKRLAAQRVVEALDLSTSPSELYAVRARVERELCRRAAAAGADEEFRFGDLAAELHAALLATEPALAGLSVSCLADQLLDAELAVERSVQRLDHHVVAALDEHVAAGGRLVLVSDFYLSAPQLALLLASAGYGADRYERLVTSADHLVTKRSGRLYDLVLEQVGADPAEVLMVGDNAHSDGVSAQARGVHSVVLERPVLRRRYAAWSAQVADASKTAAMLDGVLGTDPRPGTGPDVFPELALTVASFVRLLERDLRRAGVPDVLLLAREGQLLQRLLLRQQQALGIDAQRRLRVHYAHVSRRATFLPSLGPLDDEEFTSLFRQYRAISVQEFLLNLGFARDEATALAHAAGVAPERVEPDLPTSSAFRALRASAAFRSAYEARRAEQSALLRDYVRQLGPDLDRQPLVVVDVGWKGTIQDHLDAALRPVHGTTGHYLGLVAGEVTARNRKHGVLFDFRRADRYYAVFDENRALYEVALTAPHGSTAGYRRGRDGRVEPVLEAMPASEQHVAEVVARLQDRLAPRAEQLLDVLAVKLVDEDALRRHTAHRHARMVLFPRRDELEWFRGMTHEENFGLFRQTRFAASRRPGRRERVRTVGRLLTAPRSVLVGSFWPRLGLVELGLAPLGVVYALYKVRRVVRVR